MSVYEDRPLPPQMSKIWKGVIADPPDDIGSTLSVRIPDMNPDLSFSGVKWQSRDNTTLPARGDECLVIFDNDREPWVVAWWPFS